jgi:hypothetical protein
MSNIITIKVPETKENREIVASLLVIPGVTIECGPRRNVFEREYMNLYELSDYLGKHYYTVRRWVVVEKLIPFERPSGAGQGHVVVSKKAADEFLAGKFKKKRPGRKSREVSIL